jgi:hypothetical protein
MSRNAPFCSRATLASWSLVAIVAAGAFLMAPTGISLAADLNAYDDYRPRAGSPYDDPRYADLYGREERQRHVGKVPAPYPHESKKQHDESIYLDQYGRRIERRGPPERDRYAERYEEEREVRRHDRSRYYDERGGDDGRRFRMADHCTPRPLVMRRLLRDGWYSFADIEFRGELAVVSAENEDGGRYRLVIERCSGEVVRAHRIGYRHTDWRRSRYGGPRY